MNKDLIKSLAVAASLIAVALAATAARTAGVLDGDTVTRVVMGVTGLLLVWYGNRMPKTFVAAERARHVQRVGGWSMVISGFVYATLWAFAPLDLAFAGGITAVIAGLTVTVAACLFARRKAAASL